MPRARKQPIQVAPGSTYGEAQQLAQMQQQIPLPQQGPSLDAAAMDQAMAAEPPMPGGLFGTASARPSEPLTAGLPLGAGPGPESVVGTGRRQANLVAQLRTAAELTGNPMLAAMVTKAEQRPMPRLPQSKPL